MDRPGLGSGQFPIQAQHREYVQRSTKEFIGHELCHQVPFTVHLKPWEGRQAPVLNPRMG